MRRPWRLVDRQRRGVRRQHRVVAHPHLELREHAPLDHQILDDRLDRHVRPARAAGVERGQDARELGVALARRHALPPAALLDERSSGLEGVGQRLGLQVAHAHLDPGGIASPRSAAQTTEPARTRLHRPRLMLGRPTPILLGLSQLEEADQFLHTGPMSRSATREASISTAASTAVPAASSTRSPRSGAGSSAGPRAASSAPARTRTTAERRAVEQKARRRAGAHASRAPRGRAQLRTRRGACSMSPPPHGPRERPPSPARGRGAAGEDPVGAVESPTSRGSRTVRRSRDRSERPRRRLLRAPRSRSRVADERSRSAARHTPSMAASWAGAPRAGRNTAFARRMSVRARSRPDRPGSRESINAPMKTPAWRYEHAPDGCRASSWTERPSLSAYRRAR